MNSQQHKNVTKAEFSRQAQQIVSAPSFNDRDTLIGIIDAVGPTYQDRILDVACGTGVVAFQLAKAAKEVVGLDLTGEMLQKARKERHDRGVVNVHFELGEAEALPFKDNQFDASVCRMSIHHFDDPQQALDEMVRVTRPHGRIVIADIVTSSEQQDAKLHNAIERLRDPSHVRMLSRDELLNLITTCGLEIEKTDTWKKVRFFEEWAEVLNAPERIEPVQEVLIALAKTGVQAGINLQLNETGQLSFEHAWLLVAARKPE